MTNKEWKELIAAEFGVSNTVAKGMLHAMYKAKEYLQVPKDVHRKRLEEEKRMKEEEKRMEKQREEWEYQDWCDAEFMSHSLQR